MFYGNPSNVRSRRCSRTLKKQAIEFCLRTGLHGYKYMAHSKRSKIERIIWGITVISSLAFAAVLMHTAWEYNSSRATLTVIESTHRGIWNYPFPAVTICNLNRISYSKAREFVNRLKLPHNWTPNYAHNEMKLLLELVNPGIFGGNVQSNLSTLQDIFDHNNLTIPQVISVISQNCSTLIRYCEWKGITVSCDQVFEESLSREGFCCSFNYINTREKAKKQQPERVTACGYQTGLTLILKPEPKDYFANVLGAYGTKVMLHFAYDYPDRNAENKMVSPEHQIFLSISPEETHSTPNVRKLAISSRNCIFRDEAERLHLLQGHQSNLTYAKYSYTNCVSQCRATIIRAHCGCIPYYYPQNNSRVCNLRDVECLENYAEWYDTSFPGVSLSSHTIFTSKSSNYKDRPCNCQPDCTLYRYPVEASISILDKVHSYDRIDVFQNMDVQTQSLVHIFFSDLVSIQYRRSMTYDWRNVFASFGGLLGLFAGFSLISGFELLYFFVVRVITDSYMKKKNKLQSY